MLRFKCHFNLKRRLSRLRLLAFHYFSLTTRGNNVGKMCLKYQRRTTEAWYNFNEYIAHVFGHCKEIQCTVNTLNVCCTRVLFTVHRSSCGVNITYSPFRIMTEVVFEGPDFDCDEQRVQKKFLDMINV